MSDEPKRASDPGIRLSQVGGAAWVVCPRCAGPARHDGSVSCVKCGFSTGSQARRAQRLTLIKYSPHCERRQCGASIPSEGVPATRRPKQDDTLFAKVRCPTCGHIGRYPARPGVDKRHLGDRNSWPRRFPMYLHRSIGGYTLWVYNLEHLKLLEDWLSADLRERGPVAGLTMMARLPLWMKTAANRPRVVRALAEMREQAAREGLS